LVLLITLNFPCHLFNFFSQDRTPKLLWSFHIPVEKRYEMLLVCRYKFFSLSRTKIRICAYDTGWAFFSPKLNICDYIGHVRNYKHIYVMNGTRVYGQGVKCSGHQENR
jgi:hypothetical protein